MTLKLDEHTQWTDHTFEQLDQPQTKLTNVVFEQCRFKQCNFNETTFKSCRFVDCEWLNCKLNLARFPHCKFIDVVFEDSQLVGIDWTIAAWPNIALTSPLKFYRCKLNQSVFMGLELSEIVMIDCQAREVDFREANLTEADFSGCQFTGSLFNGNKLTSANFSDATDYAIHLHHNDIKHAKFSLPEAMSLLAGLDIEIVEE